jgi:hypothetical protein
MNEALESPLPCREGKRDWIRMQIAALFDLPFMDRIWQARQ